MIVALHIDSLDWSKLLGVWSAPGSRDGFPDCFYPDTAVGREDAARNVAAKGSRPTWESWFKQLAYSSPNPGHSPYWSVQEVDDGLPLDEVFATWQPEVLASAVSLAASEVGGDFTIVVPGVSKAAFSAKQLVESFGGPTAPFTPGGRLSTLCTFFEGGGQLVVVCRPKVEQSQADMALAWGLAYRGDRELTVVLPESMSGPTSVRAPWLLPTVRVFTYENGVTSEPLPLSKEQSIESYRRWFAPPPAVLGDKADWIRPLLDWAAVSPALDPVERGNYIAWHVHGRQVLKIVPSGKALKITAGVDAQSTFLGHEAVKTTLSKAAEHHELYALQAAVCAAAADRLAGLDSGHGEHKMQALLRPEQVGLTHWKREFPAWRPGSDSAAFIDFLGADANGRIHIVETKIGHDTMLIFQGLDYWLWCKANQANVQAALGTTNPRSPIIEFVVAAAKPGADVVSPYTAAQAEALHREIMWRFTIVTDPAAVTKVHKLPPYQLPAPLHRAGQTSKRWAHRLHDHALTAVVAANVKLVNTHSYSDLTQALAPEAHAVYEQLAQLGLVHSHIAHIRSSQAFALNLLAPLTLDKWSQLARYHLADPGAEVRRPPQFEYVDPVDGLHEGTKASPHTTQVDCLVEVYLTGERKHLMLIEVKLSEDNFSTCSAFTSPGNPRREICRQPLPFGGNRAGCFQLCNHDREHRRTYDIALGAMPTEPRRMGCWFRDGANQVMRNAALARAHVQRDDAQSASVFLLAPDDHHAIWHQWQQHVELLDWVTGITFGSIPASQVVALHEPDQARALSTRYLLPQVLLETRIAQQLLDQHFPHGVNVTRLDDDGTLNYTDHVPRLPVVAVSDTEIDFETPYPAGPFRHRAPRSIFDGALSEIRLAEDFGSRILTPNRAGSADASCQELEKWAHELQVRAPWWTAPVNHG